MKFRPLLITQLFIFLVPLFFLPVTRDFIDFNKNMLLFGLSMAALIVFAFKSIKEKKLTLHIDRLHYAVLALVASYVLSLIVMSPNKVEALLQPGGVSTIISLAILYFIVPQLTPLKSSRDVLIPLLASAVVVSLYSILNMFGLLNTLPLPAILKNPNVTPAGPLLTASIFLGIVSAATAKELIMSKKQKLNSLLVFGAAFLIILGGFVVNAFRLTQSDSRPLFLPTAASWAIAAENIKVPLQALFGVGPGNYTNAFTIGRPAGLNTIDVWNIRFSSASNYLLHLFTEVGLLGLVSFLVLIYFTVRHKNKSLGAIVTLIALAVFSPNIVTLTLLFLFLMVMTSRNAVEVSFPDTSNRQQHAALAHALGLEHQKLPSFSFVPAATAIALVLIAGSALYFSSIAYRAEVAMTQGILSAATPNNQQTYDLQRKALELNPYHSEYRIIFSRTNLALANLISQKEEPTEEDVQTVTQLVLQSVNNGKLAVQLKPGATSWENLATIYRNLINAAEGAADWTVQSYNQAIAFDQTNVVLRLNLGQVYYSLRLYEPAARQFEIAAQLKPDFANAWYNLANANRELGNIQVARLAYNQTLALIDPNSPDFQTAQAELNALPAEIAQEDRNLQELQNPEDATEQQVDTNVELTEDEGPELTFPEDVAGEATESAGTEEEGNFDLNEPSPTTSVSPTATPTPAE
ncbi:hypothetical protein HY469_00720 [Candidatus Roizmanbacteria bacterium]|nr:hypothetical protein [Candidatus Roizmanbacteria bacterium]